MAVHLEIAAAAGDDRLCRQILDLAVAEVGDALLALIQVLRAPHTDHAGHGRLDGVALVLQVVPDQEMIVRIRRHDLGYLGDARGHAVALLAGGGRQSHGHVRDQQALTVLFSASRAVIARHLVKAHVERRQVVAVVRMAKVARALDEDRPAGHPQPEFLLLVRVQRQVAGLLAVALEEACQGLPSVHHTQEASIVDQFLEAVGRRRGRVDEFELDLLEQRQEFLIGLAAVAAQHTGLVQADGAELAHVDLALAYRFVVRQVDDVLAINLGVRADEPHLHLVFASEALRGLADELLAHAQGQHDQAQAWPVNADLAHDLQVRAGLVQAERGEDSALPAGQGPAHNVAGVWLEARMDIGQRHVEALALGQLDLAAQEFAVFDFFQVFLLLRAKGAHGCSNEG